MVSLFGIFWTSGDILGICEHILQTYLHTRQFSGKVIVFHHWMTIWVINHGSLFPFGGYPTSCDF